MVVQHSFIVTTGGRGSLEITGHINSIVAESGVRTGLCHVFIKHTSASLIISENADPDVHTDLETFMTRIVPDGDPAFRHTAEGVDDMAAHVRSVLTQTELSVPVAQGQCSLGTWQGIYLWEHRAASHARTIIVTLFS